MKVVAYSGTRNVYYRMIPAVKSLLKNTPIDQVYLLIEDDIFPYDLPEKVQCINVSNQQWFKKETCMNWYDGWGGYMVLIRSVYSKLFPDLDYILSLDIDTIVDKDISAIWNLDMTDYYVAGVRDTPEFNKNGLYINGGVLFQNLKKIREDKVDEKMIFRINHFRKEYAEQDILNEVYKGHILELPSQYNSHSLFMNYDPKEPKIYHFAGIRDYFFVNPMVRKYINMKWEDI